MVSTANWCTKQWDYHQKSSLPLRKHSNAHYQQKKVESHFNQFNSNFRFYWLFWNILQQFYVILRPDCSLDFLCEFDLFSITRIYFRRRKSHTIGFGNLSVGCENQSQTFTSEKKFKMLVRRNFKKYIRIAALDGAQVSCCYSNQLQKCGKHHLFPLICRRFESLLCIFVAIQRFTVFVILRNEGCIGANGE